MCKKYNPFKYEKTVQFRPISKAVLRLLEIILGKGITLEFREELPNEPLIICPNHAMEFGPFAVQAKQNKARPCRIFTHAGIIRARTIPKHVMKDILPGKKGLSYAFFYSMAALISPLFSGVVKSMEPIPVEHGGNHELINRKTAETLKDGKDVVIFPESNRQDLSRQYVNILQPGLPHIIEYLKEKEGLNPWVVPAYMCKSLKKVVYGKPIKFEYDTYTHAGAAKFLNQISDAIEELALSLPPHKITYYDNSTRVKGDIKEKE